MNIFLKASYSDNDNFDNFDCWKYWTMYSWKIFKEKRRTVSSLKCGFMMFNIWTAWKKWLVDIYVVVSLEHPWFLIRSRTVFIYVLLTVNITIFTLPTTFLPFLDSEERNFRLFMFDRYQFFKILFFNRDRIT